MNKYETIFIMDPDLQEEQTQATVERAKNIIAQAEGAELLKLEDWGVRKLAYQVKKKVNGHYILLHFKGAPALLSELHRNFRVMDAVIKFQSIRLDELQESTLKAPPPEEPSEEESETKVG